MTNSMCEAVTPMLEKLTGGRALLILSNYSTIRLARASAIFRKDLIGGSRIVDDMIRGYEFAQYDVNRAVTHNKGVMNAVIAIANATGQDGRALEAAAGAYACRNGRYEPLTVWSKDAKGNYQRYHRDAHAGRSRRRNISSSSYITHMHKNS